MILKTVVGLVYAFLLLPMVVYEQVLSVFDWPFGAANAFVLLVISVVLIGVYIKVTERALRGIV